MKGRAPNCSKMGSQTEVRKKWKPNLCRGRTEPCHNSKTRRRVTSTTEAANKKVIIRAISSPWRSRERNEREPATGPALGTVLVVVAMLLDVIQGLDRKSTRLNSSHLVISYAVFCLKKKNKQH